MAHIFLLILKIIGLFLLAILGILLLILFFPVTYKGKGRFRQEERTLKLTAGWLFHFVHCKIVVDRKDVLYCLRILGIPILSSKRRDTKSRKNKKYKSSSEEVKKKKEECVDVSKEPEKIKDGSINLPKEQKILKDDSISISKQPEAIRDDSVVAPGKSKKKQKKSWFKTIRNMWERFLFAMKELKDNAQKTTEKIKEAKTFLSSNTTKEAYRYGKKILLHMIRHILPGSIKAQIRFGFEQPDQTGKTLGCLAMLYGTFGINPKKIKLNPDFQNKVLEGDIRFRGSIIGCVLVIDCLKLYFKKEIRSIIKKFN